MEVTRCCAEHVPVLQWVYESEVHPIIADGEGHYQLRYHHLLNESTAPDGKQLASLIDSQVHVAADQVKEWPEEDLYGVYLKR